MSDAVIKVMDKGPLMVSGPVELVDAEGNRFQTKEQFYLCRCGHSTNKPFCTGAHTKAGFDDCARAR